MNKMEPDISLKVLSLAISGEHGWTQGPLSLLLPFTSCHFSRQALLSQRHWLHFPSPDRSAGTGATGFLAATPAETPGPGAKCDCSLLPIAPGSRLHTISHPFPLPRPSDSFTSTRLTLLTLHRSLEKLGPSFLFSENFQGCPLLVPSTGLPLANLCSHHILATSCVLILLAPPEELPPPTSKLSL